MKVLNHQSKILNGEMGFSMVELIITIAILSFGIIGIYGFLHPTSILSSNFSLRLTSSYLGQEGLEIVKNIRDNNILSGSQWSEGFDICNTGCQLDYKTGTLLETPANALQTYLDIPLNLDGDGFYSYDLGSATKFKRKITITQPSLDNNILKVDVLVMWDHNEQSFSFNTVGYIYNY